MTYATREKMERGGSLVHAEGGTGVSHCLACGWRGVPTFVQGQILHECPRCEVDYDELERELNEAAWAKTTGRNDPCPCGSGRKWKKCHGR